MHAPSLSAAQVNHPFPPERFLPYMTSREVAELPKDDAAVVLAVAAVEQHGPHLPLATDLLSGVALLTMALERMAPSTNIWVLPPLPFSKSNEHATFPGTISLSQATLSSVIFDVAESVSRAGFKRLVLFNCHGGNTSVIDYVARDVRERTNLMVFPFSFFTIGLSYSHISEQEERLGTHAGEWETSLMLALAPELVHLERAQELGNYVEFTNAPEHLSLLGPIKFAWLTHDVSSSGAIGDPRPAEASRGEDLRERTVKKVAATLEEICTFEMPSPASS
jgi:creatinine amidohydrolase/Fe(II)-dependent formamide hydrolase-like protein